MWVWGRTKLYQLLRQSSRNSRVFLAIRVLAASCYRSVSISMLDRCDGPRRRQPFPDAL
jgi:hypothetical protein